MPNETIILTDEGGSKLELTKLQHTIRIEIGDESFHLHRFDIQELIVELEHLKNKFD